MNQTDKDKTKRSCCGVESPSYVLCLNFEHVTNFKLLLSPIVVLSSKCTPCTLHFPQLMPLAWLHSFHVLTGPPSVVPKLWSISLVSCLLTNFGAASVRYAHAVASESFSPKSTCCFSYMHLLLLVPLLPLLVSLSTLIVSKSEPFL